MKNGKNMAKPICMGVLFCAFVYGLALPFFWGNNPASELGTLSLLCENRKVYFWLWGILTSGGIFINTQYMYNKFGMKNKLLTVLGALGFVSICAVALTLGHSIEDWNPKRLAHWIATGFFIAFTVASIALYFIINRKRHGKQRNDSENDGTVQDSPIGSEIKRKNSRYYWIWLSGACSRIKP